MAHLEFPRADGLILRCAGKGGNPFQTTQGNRLSCRDQEGRRGSEEAVPGPSVFPSREPGMSGAPPPPQDPSPLRGTLGSSLTLETPSRARASSCQAVGTTWFFSSCADRRVPAGLRQESQASSCLSNGTLLASRVVQWVSGPLSSCVWNLPNK